VECIPARCAVVAIRRRQRYRHGRAAARRRTPGTFRPPRGGSITEITDRSTTLSELAVVERGEHRQGRTVWSGLQPPPEQRRVCRYMFAKAPVVHPYCRGVTEKAFIAARFVAGHDQSRGACNAVPCAPRGHGDEVQRRRIVVIKLQPGWLPLGIS
jgi:hypothetical protein